MIEQGKLAKVIEGLDACLEGLCEACSYRDVDAPGGCKDALMYDAFALLKAQEPRVMTLEEALDAECVYLDVRPHPSLQCECCILIKDEDGDTVPVNKGFWGSLEGEDYGIDWRCWTSRPTDEQRKETPWN